MNNKTYTIEADKVTKIAECLSIADILNNSFRRYQDKLYWLKNWPGISDSVRGFILRHLNGDIK